MNAKLQIYAELDAQVEAATAEWNRLALAAWHRLREADAELADLAISLFESEEAAASWFARPQSDITCYGRLATGDREGVYQQLIAGQHGIF